MYRTTVVQAYSGVTERNSHWSYPLFAFTLPMQNRLQTELQEILDAFHAAGGRGNTFDFFDRAEDRSCGLDETPAQDDVTLGTATVGQTDFQLFKDYAFGGVTQRRKITRPTASTILVEVDGVLQTQGADYTVEALGLIRFTTPLLGGEEVKAGFRFNVPVAFLSDDIDITIHNFSGQLVGDSNIDLIEVRE